MTHTHTHFLSRIKVSIRVAYGFSVWTSWRLVATMIKRVGVGLNWFRVAG